MNNNFNPYGAYSPQDYQKFIENQQEIRKEKRNLRKRSMYIAFGVWGFVIVSAVVGVLLGANQKFYNLYVNNLNFQLAFESIIAIVMIYLPFRISYAALNKNENYIIPYSMGENKKFFWLLIPVGLAACFIGSLATGIFSTFCENIFNVTFTMEEYEIPTDTLGISLFLLRSALIPCLVEEYAIRGVALGSLRKYGDGFAIVASAFIFAILHGNMIQIPFAFIAGIALGYIAVATGSIWPGIIIHFINNLVSSILSLTVDNPATGNYFYFGYLVLMVVVIGIAVFCLMNYVKDKDRPFLSKGTSKLSMGEKTAGFVFTIPMVIAILYMAVVTSQYIE